MGSENGKLSTSLSESLIKNYKPDETIHHTVYHYGTVLTDLKNNRQIFEKKYYIQNQYDEQRWNQRLNIKMPNILRQLSYRELVNDSFCNDVSIFFAYYEYYSQTLSDEIKFRKDNNSRFLEEEIWYIIYQLTYELIQLRQEQVFHKKLIPETILITSDLTTIVAPMNTFMEDPQLGLLSDKKYSQLLKEYKLSMDTQIDWERIDMIGLGLTILNMISCDNKLFQTIDQIIFEIDKMFSQYSIDLITITQALLIFDEEHRFGLHQMAEVLEDFIDLILKKKRFSFKDCNKQQSELQNAQKIQIFFKQYLINEKIKAKNLVNISGSQLNKSNVTQQIYESNQLSLNNHECNSQEIYSEQDHASFVEFQVNTPDKNTQIKIVDSAKSNPIQNSQSLRPITHSKFAIKELPPAIPISKDQTVVIPVNQNISEASKYPMVQQNTQQVIVQNNSLMTGDIDQIVGKYQRESAYTPKTTQYNSQLPLNITPKQIDNNILTQNNNNNGSNIYNPLTIKQPEINSHVSSQMSNKHLDIYLTKDQDTLHLQQSLHETIKSRIYSDMPSQSPSKIKDVIIESELLLQLYKF